jgi:hypothetical protein
MSRKIIGITVGTPLNPDKYSGGGTGGGLNITDDGNGNVTITPVGNISITDDGQGNVTIL